MNISAFRYYSEFYKGAYHHIVLSIVGSILQSIIIIAIPFLIRYVFDDIIETKDFTLLASVGLAIIVLYIIECSIALYVRHIIIKATKNAVLKLRQEILNKFYSLSRKYYSEADHSKMHDIAVHDTERVDIMSNSLVAYIIPAVIICAPLCIFLIYLNYLLFLLMLIALPLFLAIIVPIRKKLQKRVGGFHGAFEVFSKGVMFVLEAMDLTRIRVAEALELKKQSKNLEELRDVGGSMAWLASAYISIQRTIYASTGVVILIVGGIAVIKRYMTLGDLISFFIALSFMKAQVHMVVFTMPHIIEGSESLSRLYEFIEIKEPRPYTGSKQIDFMGKITLESVHFQYDRLPVLHDINLSIHPGTTVAIVGSNGAGKTSIAHLILGFYRPGSGRLYADDHPYPELDISHLRRYIGVVTQNPIIFAGTVRENIAYGYPDASMEEVIQAAQLATAHEFILKLPDGYDTPVGEGGVLLSGGQRQRIAIARALLGEPRLLILDEPTNNLDAASVGLIIENLKSLDHIKSTLIISHDTDIVREAQHIYILQEGRIISSGSYESLSPQAMKVAGIY